MQFALFYMLMQENEISFLKVIWAILHLLSQVQAYLYVGLMMARKLAETISAGSLIVLCVTEY